MLTTLALAAAITATPQKSVYDFDVQTIKGETISLSKFKGHPLVIVNVASKCGMTPQYEGLEAMYREYKEQGLIVIGFPANQFGGQEPGTDEEILKFCTAKYDVTFPMMSKIVVKGDGIHPLYAYLTTVTDNKEIEWNFAKFVINRDGLVTARFHPKVKPNDPAFVAAVEQALER